jgi:hypothetical protein
VVLLWFLLEEILKFKIGARNSKNDTAIGGRDVRLICLQKCVWCKHLRKKCFPWFSRSLQTNYKFAMIINYFARVARHASGAARALKLLRAHQFVRKPSGNVFVRLGLKPEIRL